MQGRKAVSILNGILWDKNITIENKKIIYNSIVKSIITYSSEVWPLKEKTERTRKATEMDFWRRSAGKSRIDKIPSETIRRQMELKHDIEDDIRTQQLIWYGHGQRMEEHRIPKKIFNWNPQGRRKIGRPGRSWREGIDKEVLYRGLEVNGWGDRERWRLGIERRETVITRLYIYGVMF
ncbi:uncharacterized protein LOC115879091 [Sitophilus oryzae]|uniref:Uncharacterized protein LOC115879091 n=1 Tax=Sitophilus oryzae TaxID=7048 RepID=A0A6J2XLQ6_SITOR|nr:uncharacterized protein LOC115879091 [Sitophilus oryzae]